MKKPIIVTLLTTIFLFTMQAETKVLIQTTMGDIVVRLYDETPQHRDNFIKLVESGYYNDLIFHRVIKDFMIQGGDPDSKNAAPTQQLGAGGPDYTIPAEFVYPKYFHKRGALSAARQSDQVNPLKASSGSQFYIVWGQVYTPSQMKQMEVQKVEQMKNAYFQNLAMQQQDKIRAMYQAQDQAGLQRLQQELAYQTDKYFAEHPVQPFTAEQIQSYTTVGGTPFLDNEYTVFGEVVEGLEVVEKIQAVKTQPGDRPEQDIKMKMSLVKD